MALARLGSNRRSESYTWPGFVDALATLLMVIIFVLMVFVLIQVNLAYRVSGQDATLGEMRQQLVSLTELLNLERKASSDLAADLAQISRELEVTTTERDDILAQLANATDALAASTAENVVLSEKQEATLAALEAARLRLDERLAALTAAEQNLAEANTKLAASETSLASTESSLAAALEKLAQTQQESVEANKQADSLAAENAASRAEILQMTKATTALRRRAVDDELRWRERRAVRGRHSYLWQFHRQCRQHRCEPQTFRRLRSCVPDAAAPADAAVAAAAAAGG